VGKVDTTTIIQIIRHKTFILKTHRDAEFEYGRCGRAHEMLTMGKDDFSQLDAGGRLKIFRHKRHKHQYAEKQYNQSRGEEFSPLGRITGRVVRLP
jgi:hypothetical protein